MRIYKIASVLSDTKGERLGLQEKYILKLKWEYIRDPDAPYFLGGGSFHSPEMVFMPSEASIVTGSQLLNTAYPWYEKWEAIRA